MYPDKKHLKIDYFRHANFNLSSTVFKAQSRQLMT